MQIFMKNDFLSVFLNGSILYLILSYYAMIVLSTVCFELTMNVKIQVMMQKKQRSTYEKGRDSDSWNTPKGCCRVELPPFQTLSLFCTPNTTLLLSYLHMCFVIWRMMWVGSLYYIWCMFFLWCIFRELYIKLQMKNTLFKKTLLMETK